MTKYIAISLQHIDEVREAIDLDKAQKDGEHFIIVHDGNLADSKCILALIKAGYTINKYSDVLKFIKYTNKQ